MTNPQPTPQGEAQTEPGTVQMTAALLNRQISVERGWIIESEGLGACAYLPGVTSKEEQPAFVNMRYVDEVALPQHLTDANITLGLLNELPILDIGRQHDGWHIMFWIADSEAETCTHEDFRTAVCLSWLLWKTGRRVTLIDG